MFRKNKKTLDTRAVNDWNIRNVKKKTKQN